MELYFSSHPDEEMRFLLEIPTTNLENCRNSLIIDGSISAKICEITVIFALTNLEIFGVSSDYADHFIELHKKDLEIQSMYDAVTGFHIKSSLIERFESKCKDCNQDVSQELVFRACQDEKCSQEISSYQTGLNQTLYFFLDYQSPVYTYNRAILAVEVYLTREVLTAPELVSTGVEVSDSILGNDGSKMVREM